MKNRPGIAPGNAAGFLRPVRCGFGNRLFFGRGMLDGACRDEPGKIFEKGQMSGEKP
jgi:hypothetical protein